MIHTNSPKWYSETLEKGDYFPLLGDYRTQNGAKLYSGVWENDLSTLRMCILTVEGKFFAETVVIFPKYGVNTPIFGSEYIKTPGKTLAAVDFHPVNGDISQIQVVLGSEPTCPTQKSRHYDLKTHFSPWLWLKKSENTPYDEYSSICSSRSGKYCDILESAQRVKSQHPLTYCEYMSEHDPARGILKAYFGSVFSDDYINRFLFPNNSDIVGNFCRI